MTFTDFIKGLLKALESDHASRKRRRQERIDSMYNDANEAAKVKCRDRMRPYDPKNDGNFISILDGCE